MIVSYEEVLKTYRRADFSRARGLVEQHRVVFPHDRAAATLQRITEDAGQQPRPATWDAVTRMEQK